MVTVMLLMFLFFSRAQGTFVPLFDGTKAGFTYAFGDSDNNRKCGQNIAKGLAVSTLVLVTEKNLNEREILQDKTIACIVGQTMVFGGTLMFPHTKTWSQKFAYFVGALAPFLYSFYNQDMLPPRYHTPSPQQSPHDN